MDTQVESQLVYVRRMLNNPAYNLSEVCRVTKLAIATVHKIAKGTTKNPTYETVETIANYFKGLERGRQ